MVQRAAVLKVGQLRERLRGSLWFVPTICVAAAIVLSQLLVRAVPRSSGGWLFGGGADSARTLLSTLAASMITFLGLTFSITMVVLQLTSSQYSPRVLRSFLRDRQSQWTLGIFVATFVYVVLVLRDVRGTAGEVEQFVPGAAMTFAFVLLLLSIGAFVAYINHMAQSIRPENILASVAAETRSLIDRRPQLAGVHPKLDGHAVADPSGGDRSVTSTADGILQSVDVDRLVRLGQDHRLVISLACRIGDFVPVGTVLFELHTDGSGAGLPGEDLADPLRACVGIGRDRTMQQDLGFGLRQLVDVGVRALSPSLNDPTTAVQAIDQLHTLLRRLASKEMPSPVHVDDRGIRRVVLPTPTWDDMVHLAFDELRHHGGGSMQVLRRLRHAMVDLADCVPPGRKLAIHEQLRLLDAAARRSFPDPIDRGSASAPDAQGIR